MSQAVSDWVLAIQVDIALAIWRRCEAFQCNEVGEKVSGKNDVVKLRVNLEKMTVIRPV